MSSPARRRPAAALCVAAAVVLAARPAAAAPPDLSGLWEQDAAASTSTKTLEAAPDPNAPPAPPPPPAAEGAPPRLRVTLQPPLLVFDLLNADGSKLSSTVVTADGADNVNVRVPGSVYHRSRSRWNGSVLETSWQIERDGQVAVSGTETRELRDADTLVVTTTTADAKSTSRTVAVYRRVR